MKRFEATLDSLSKTLTFVICVVMVIPFIAIARLTVTSGDWRLLIFPVLIVILFSIIALYRVKGYTVDAGAITVLRPVKPVTIRINEIRSLEIVSLKDLGFGLRTFGNGGFLGYTGRYVYKNVGNVTMYATDRSKLMLITLSDDRKILISPADPAAFMKAFSELCRQRNRP